MLTIFCIVFLLGHAVASVPSQRERLDIVGYLTRLRRDVSPPASNMNHLMYSVAMESLAVDWVSRCLFQYPRPAEHPQFNGTGLILQTGLDPISEFATGVSFLHEQQKYNYYRNTCSGTCRNYKLMVWAASTEVGCAKQRCVLNEDSQNQNYLLVCVFSNSDNAVKGRPYEKGLSCSSCRGEYKCSDRQCYQKISSNEEKHTSSPRPSTQALPTSLATALSSPTHTTTSHSTIALIETMPTAITSTSASQTHSTTSDSTATSTEALPTPSTSTSASPTLTTTSDSTTSPRVTPMNKSTPSFKQHQPQITSIPRSTIWSTTTQNPNQTMLRLGSNSTQGIWQFAKIIIQIFV